MENYLLAMGVFAGLYALMALGLNLIWGVAGMINLGLAGSVAVGAYTSALLTVKLGWPIAAGWAAAALTSALLGAGIAVVTARLRGDYLAIVTLGFAEVIRLGAGNEIWLTNGTDGISGVPGPWRAELDALQFNLVYLCLVWAAVAILGLILARLATAPFGRVLRAIREDEVVAQVAGHRILRFKVQAFAVGSAVLGLAGGMYAHFNAYVAPDAFMPLLTIYVVLALTAGGTGRMPAAAVGAVLVVFLLEGTRFLAGILPGFTPVQIAALREAVIGGTLILLLHLRPDGLLPERPPHYERTAA